MVSINTREWCCISNSINSISDSIKEENFILSLLAVPIVNLSLQLLLERKKNKQNRLPTKDDVKKKGRRKKE